jgi:hypothetical protein
VTAGQQTTEHKLSTVRAVLAAPWASVGWRREAATLALLFGVALLLWTLAYQVPYTARLPIGGDTQTHRREDDAPFLSGFHASEPDDGTTWQWWTLEPAYGYRWTQAESTVRLPGMGGGPWVVSLHANSGRPGGEGVTSSWQVGQTALPALSIPASGRVYRLLTHADAAGNLRIHLETPPYISPTDPRPLGFVLREVVAAPAATPLRPPAWGTLGWLAAALGLFYGLGRWLVLPRRPARLLGLASAALLALLLALHRPTVALMSPTLAGLALGCWGLALAGRLALAASARPALATRSQTGAIVALILLAFALRAGGMLYPHARFSDHLLHANNVLEVGLGNVYFTEGLPDTRGGGDAPYPPGLYLLVAPALTFAPADMESRALLVQLGVALLDSLVLALIWLLLRRAGLGQPAALLGAALYLLPLPMLLSFARGEYANLGGQVLALPVLALLGLGGARSGAGGRGVLLLALLASIGLLSHMGVAISLALVLGAAWLLGVGYWLRRRGEHGALPLAPGVLTAGGAAAAGFVGLCYYSAPQFVALFAARLTSGSTGPPAERISPLAELGGIVAGLFAPWSELLPLLVGLGLAGALLLWWVPPHTPSRNSLRALLLAWWLGSGLSFALLLVAQQGVRWEHFLLPALCLGGGVALAALWRRGQAGRLVALGSLLAVLLHALTRWLAFVYDYLH